MLVNRMFSFGDQMAVVWVCGADFHSRQWLAVDVSEELIQGWLWVGLCLDHSVVNLLLHLVINQLITNITTTTMPSVALLNKRISN